MQHDLTAQLYLTFLPITQTEVPIMKASEATKRLGDRTETNIEAKNTHFFGRQSCRPVTTLSGDTIKTMKIVHGWLAMPMHATK